MIRGEVKKMSVILYEDDKFLRIYETLKLQRKDLAHLWLYPKGWDGNGMDKKLQKFVNCLRNANIDATNERYDEKHPFVVLDFTHRSVLSWLSQFELIKSLHSISYNSVESEKFNRTKDKLRDVIYFLMDSVISNMPEYEQAQTW